MRLRTRLLPFTAMTSGLLAEWHRLDREAIEPNIYLSPHFVIPAVRHLTPSDPPMLTVVEDQDAPHGTRLRLLGLLHAKFASRILAMRHFRAYQTLHTFSTGLLVGLEAKEAAVHAWISFLMNYHPRHYGLEFNLIRADRPVFSLLRHAAADLGVEWFALRRFQRAVLDRRIDDWPDSPGPKDVRRNWRRLQQAGRVEYRIVGPDNPDVESIERHLSLEHMGWKGDAGTSMLRRPAEAAFFREMAGNFLSEGRALFAELILDGEVIASTSNFLAGSELFAFKAGFNPAFSGFGPGIINEMKLLDNARTAMRDLTGIDSGTAGPSYIDRLLPDRSRVVSGFFALSGIARQWLRLVRSTKPFKDALGLWTAGASGGR